MAQQGNVATSLHVEAISEKIIPVRAVRAALGITELWRSFWIIAKFFFIWLKDHRLVQKGYNTANKQNSFMHECIYQLILFRYLLDNNVSPMFSDQFTAGEVNGRVSILDLALQCDFSLILLYNFIWMSRSSTGVCWYQLLSDHSSDYDHISDELLHLFFDYRLFKGEINGRQSRETTVNNKRMKRTIFHNVNLNAGNTAHMNVVFPTADFGAFFDTYEISDEPPRLAFFPRSGTIGGKLVSIDSKYSIIVSTTYFLVIFS